MSDICRLLVGVADRGSTPVQTEPFSKGPYIESHLPSVILNAGLYAPEVSHKIFFDKIIPRTELTPDQVADICKHVLDNPAVYDRACERWVAFPNDSNKAPPGTKEGSVFAGLIPLSQAIAAAARACVPKLEPRTTFHSMPTNPPESGTQACLTPPDCGFIRISDRARPERITHWMDTAVSGGFTTSGNNTRTVNSDVANVLWNMHRALKEDARRRFTFAFTIQNRHTRIWFSNRSEVLVSRHFDFMREPELFIRMFLAFTYASYEGLGWDDTMMLRWDGDTPQYDITVQPFPTPDTEDGLEEELKPRTFRTKELLSGIGAEHLRGRGTRVWAVNELVNGDVGAETFVLKDTWVDSDRIREGKITATILKCVKNAKANALVKSALLSTEIHGDVLVNGVADCTLDGEFRRQLFNKNIPRFNLRQDTPKNGSKPSASDIKSKTDANRESNTASTPETKATIRPIGDHCDAGETEKAIPPISHHSKSHYRIVFKELCRPLYKATSLEDILWMLLKTSAALEVIHSVGWVHRDISSGNILMYDKDNTVKIADWEYAKKMDEPGTVRDTRTGTDDFMAVEVNEQEYIFDKGASVEISTKPTILDVTKLVKGKLKTVRGKPVAKAVWVQVGDDRPWSYNPLHDMESVFWICMFCILYKDIYYDIPDAPFRPDSQKLLEEESDEEREERIKAYYAFGQKLFAARSNRYLTLTSDSFLAKQLFKHPLHPAIGPLKDLLVCLRAELVKKYREAENDSEPITNRCADGVHRLFVAEFHDALLHLQDVGCDVKIRSLQAEAERIYQREDGVTSSKRSRKDTEDVMGDPDSHRSKASRTRLEQSPRGLLRPRRATISTLPPLTATVDATTTTTAATDPPAPIRILRSHTRKVAITEKSRPPAPARSRRSNGRRTKNDDTAKAAAWTGATAEPRSGQ